MHAHTAVASTTSQTTVPLILFVALDAMSLLMPLDLNHQSPLAATHLTQLQVLPSSSRHIRQHNLYAGISISTRVRVGAPTAASAMHASGVATHHMGSGTVVGSPPTLLPIDQHQLVSPLRPLELECELTHHPDKGSVWQLLHDIKHGCDIGYNGPHFAHTAHHLPSALEKPHIISDALDKECAAGCMTGPFPTPPLPNLRCSGLGVVPKKDGGRRIIYHLSVPYGRSVNDFIDPEQYSLRYCTINSAIAILNSLGPHSLMGKIDMRSAFQQLPVRREDWHLLGIHWQSHWYVDKCLPFGLQSSPAPSLIVWPRQLSGFCGITIESIILPIIWMISLQQGQQVLPPATKTWPR